MTYIGQHKLLSHLDRLIGLESGVVLPPINVEIDLTNRCNLGCQWCDFAHTHVSGPLSYRRTVETGDVMSTENAAKIVRQLGQYGVRSVTWTGGGEPTLHPDFGYVLQMCHEAGPDQGIYTNGTNISDSLAETIARCCRWAYVSLDATTAHRFKTSKKSDLFKNALEGIKRLVDTGMHVGVGFLIDQHNVGYFADTIKLAEEVKPTYINYRPAVKWNNEIPSEVDGDQSWFAAINWNEEAKRSTKIPVEIDTERFRAYGLWDGHGYSVCLWSALQTVITPDCRVWTCCNKRGLNGHCLGDLTKETFRSIWSRRTIAEVDSQCRVMCRGHMGNLRLHEIFSRKEHENFI